MKILFTLFVAIFTINFCSAQDGLEQIVVEKYYIANEADSQSDIFQALAPGSITYRVFADLKPGYTLGGVFGNTFQGTDHFLRISTTTFFYNNILRGAVFADDIDRERLSDDVVMLDTWLSVGAACKTCVGVLKANDNGENTIINNSGVMANDEIEPCIDINVTEEDGHIEGTPSSTTSIGLNTTYFDGETISDEVNVLETNNASWASLEGATGIDTLNHVLIGQFTTDGVFSFELNIQIRNEGTGEAETFVARDPIVNEILNEVSIPSLIFNSDSLCMTTSVFDVKFSEKYLENAVLISPNPSHDLININLLDPDLNIDQFEIIDQAGRSITKSSTNGANQIDISTLDSGLYFIKLGVEGKLLTKKFFKL